MGKTKDDDNDSSHESEMDATSAIRTQEKSSTKSPLKRKKDEDSADSIDDSLNLSGGRTKRRVAQCVVEGCAINENSTKSNGKKYTLFDPPKDKAGRLRWSLYVPGVDCAVHLLRYTKVCETHFVDGEPTKENPLPTQNLHPSAVDEFGFAAKSEQETKKTASKQTPKSSSEDIKSDDETEEKEAKLLKIKFPAQKSKKLTSLTSPPAKKLKLLPMQQVVDTRAASDMEKSTIPISSSVAKKPESPVVSPSATASVSVASILKEAVSLKPSFIRPSATASVVTLPRRINNFQSLSKPSAALINRATPPPPQRYAAATTERHFSMIRSQQIPSLSSNDDEPRELEPCQHCGLELVEIRKDLVRMENKIDVATTLLRSVLQRTLSVARPSTSIVKISQTSGNPAANIQRQEQISGAEVKVNSTGKNGNNSGATRKNILGKPMKLIINSQGQISQAPTNANSNNKVGSKSVSAVSKLGRSTEELKDTGKFDDPSSSNEKKSVRVLVNNTMKSKIPEDDDDEEEESDGADDSVNKEMSQLKYKTTTMKKIEKIAPRHVEPEEFDDISDEEEIIKDESTVDTEEYGPTWLSGVSQEEIQIVLDDLVANGLLEDKGESSMNWPNTTSKNTLIMEVYRKLSPNDVDENKLLTYGVTKRSYLTSYKQKPSKYTYQLNKICDELDD